MHFKSILIKYLVVIENFPDRRFELKGRFYSLMLYTVERAAVSITSPFWPCFVSTETTSSFNRMSYKSFRVNNNYYCINNRRMFSYLYLELISCVNTVKLHLNVFLGTLKKIKPISVKNVQVK